MSVCLSVCLSVYRQLMIRSHVNILGAQQEKQELVLSMASASKGLKAKEQEWVMKCVKSSLHPRPSTLDPSPRKPHQP